MAKVWGQHGTLRRYRQGGCNDLRGGEPGAGDRCEKCKKASADDYQKKKQEECNGGGNVTALFGNGPNVQLNGSNLGQNQSNPGPHVPGPTELAVIDQFEQYRESQPVRFQNAITCARILDNQQQANMWNPTLRQLDNITEKLTASKKKKTGGRGLVAAQAMIGRKTG